MSNEATDYPAGFTVFLTALSDYLSPLLTATVLRTDKTLTDLPFRVPLYAVVKVLNHPKENYQLLNGESTFLVCKNQTCLAPMGEKEFYKICRMRSF